jgi:hypothetical protein
MATPKSPQLSFGQAEMYLKEFVLRKCQYFSYQETDCITDGNDDETVMTVRLYSFNVRHDQESVLFRKFVFQKSEYERNLNDCLQKVGNGLRAMHEPEAQA